jgi:hypothetical protein
LRRFARNGGQGLAIAVAVFSWSGHFTAAECRQPVTSGPDGLEVEVEGELIPRVEFRGQSGRIYSFLRLSEGDALRPIGVTYVIAVADGDGWRRLQTGHTNNLAERSWANALAQARAAHPSAEILIRLNVSRSLREAEAADLQPASADGDEGPDATRRDL